MTTPSPEKNASSSHRRIMSPEKNASSSHRRIMSPEKKASSHKSHKSPSRAPLRKAPKSLAEMCAAKSGYEIIDMEDGTKSCRKRCVGSKPVRSSSKSRKCIAGTKGFFNKAQVQTEEDDDLTPAKVLAKTSRNLPPRTFEETCAARKDYEIIDMEDGTKSCRKRCVGSKPVRSSSKSRRCIAGTKPTVTGPKGKKKRTKRRRVKKVEDDILDDDDDDDDYDDYDDDFYKNMEDYEEHKDSIEREKAEAKKYNPAMKKMKDVTKIGKCLAMLSTEDLKDEIQLRQAEAPHFEIIKEPEPIKYVEQVMDVTKKGKKRIQPMAVAAIAKEKVNQSFQP